MATASAAPITETGLPAGCTVAGKAATSVPGAAAKPVFPPVQLDMRTPVAPSAVPADGRHYLIYELHLRNFAEDALALRRLEVLAAGQPVASFTGPALASLLSPVGPGKIEDRLEAGRSAVAFLCLAFERGVPVPKSLRHRIDIGGAVADGPLVAVRPGAPVVLGAPVSGAGWTADNTPSLHSHHRLGLIVAGGQAQISRRFAIDWKKLQGGAPFSGDALDVRAYHAYGENVLAVGDGTVVDARDGFPDNVPRTAAGFTPAVPVSMESIAGNTIVIDLGKGRFASYSHLQPGSVQVKVGEHVRRGQKLGRIGNSGDARWPHLHFQLTTTAHILDSEALPFVLEGYSTTTAGVRKAVRREYPMGDIVIDIDDGKSKP
jgi:murein DD-endopeptidase MepM/ murein hydrolase activator NlpD